MVESTGPLVCERRGDALLVGFNRPDKRNAIDIATTEALHQVLSDQAREVRRMTEELERARADVADAAQHRREETATPGIDFAPTIPDGSAMPVFFIRGSFGGASVDVHLL